MAAIEWQDAYSVGIDQLDADHKRLIDIINRVDDADRERRSITWALDELSDYARYHFTREEETMAAAGYAGIKAHKNRHREFLDWLRSVRLSLKMAPETQFHLGADLRDYLSRWLTGHILVEDMKYKGELGQVLSP